jgi:hypothetical protein
VRSHGLVASSRQANDAQASMTQSNLLVQVNVARIRAAVAYGVTHFLQGSLVTKRVSKSGKACNSAHRLWF